MSYLSIILVIVIVALILVIGFSGKENKENQKEIGRTEKERDEYLALGAGLAEYNQRLQERKNRLKARILELFQTKEKIAHREVAEALDVSRTSAVRYLDELEAEGRIRQVGKIGRSVFYIRENK